MASVPPTTFIPGACDEYGRPYLITWSGGSVPNPTTFQANVTLEGVLRSSSVTPATLDLGGSTKMEFVNENGFTFKLASKKILTLDGKVVTLNGVPLTVSNNLLDISSDKAEFTVPGIFIKGASNPNWGTSPLPEKLPEELATVGDLKTRTPAGEIIMSVIPPSFGIPLDGKSHVITGAPMELVATRLALLPGFSYDPVAKSLLTDDMGKDLPSPLGYYAIY